MSVEQLRAYANQLSDWLIRQASSPGFYGQIAVIAAALVAAFILARMLRPVLERLLDKSASGEESGPFAVVAAKLAFLKQLLRPLVAGLCLLIAAQVADAALGDSALVRLALGVAVIAILLSAVRSYVRHPQLNALARWIGIPLAIIVVFGYFDEFTAWLDTVAFQAGNIRISVLAILKAALFGGLLFWLGRKSTAAGQKVIRNQQEVDVQTRELAAKALEIIVFCAVGLLLLNILGMDLTALAVFGGALGVGLGFGLQQIASNFISGIIILLERSLKVGDYIQMEDGSAGTLKEINMRSSTLATFDGKEIMLPNDRFITTRFTNWTKTDALQRYEIGFSVSYDTDLHKVPPLVSAAVARHPNVLAEPEAPDCELVNFGDNGVEFSVEYWVSGIDDGPNKFSSDIRFLIWDALKEAGISMPFPQREVRIVGGEAAKSVQGSPGRTGRRNPTSSS
jgi:small-conductance mechanosensitive channel